MKQPLVGIVMGSESDYETLKQSEEILLHFEIPYEISVTSAHRTPNAMYEYASTAQKRGLKVIIAGAGGAAHLPGMVSSLTTLPVLGVPVQSKALNGIDSLLSIVQMPAGVPTATFAIGTAGATNAALFAIEILALSDDKLSKRLSDYREERASQALAGTQKVRERWRESGGQRMRRIGILGGGQLGALLAQSLYRLGGTVSIYDPDPNAPACRQTPDAVNSAWTNLSALEEFFKRSDAVTYEFENVESGSLFGFDQEKPIVPSVRVLRTTQDRVLEKTFIRDSGLPHVDFAIVNKLSEFTGVANELGFPSILKTARGGYDGKGQFSLDSAEDVKRVARQLDADGFEGRLVLERRLDISLEVSCIVARSPNGEEVSFPVLENVHTDHILDMTVVPARISTALEEAIKEIALTAARALEVYGLLTTEFFLSDKPGLNAQGVNVGGWHIYINEFAPRPHNSGHITMKACTLSQFDALARILMSVPISEPKIVAPGYFCMANLLGDIWLSQGTKELDLSTMVNYPEVIDVVLYGKSEARSKRKMGHFITYGSSAQQAVGAAKAFRESLQRNIRQAQVSAQ